MTEMDLEANVFRLMRRTLNAEEKLARIGDWHVRESGPAGMVGDYCTECDKVWPCDTRRMIDGTYEEEDYIDDNGLDSEEWYSNPN